MFDAFLANLLGLHHSSNGQAQGSLRKRLGFLGARGRRKAPRYRRTLNGCESLERRELLSGDGYPLGGFAADVLAPKIDPPTEPAIVSLFGPDITPMVDQVNMKICNECVPTVHPIILPEPASIITGPVQSVAEPPIVDQIFLELPKLYGTIQPLAQDTLPPEYESLRQAVGDKQLAELLRNFKNKWGNYQGICGTAFVEMRLHYPEIYQKFQQTEHQLEKWMQGQTAQKLPGFDPVRPQQEQATLPSNYDSFRQALGDLELAEMLQNNKQKWGNYQGVCGSAIVEMQRNYPEIYRQFADTERQLENWLQNTQNTLPSFYEALRQALGDRALTEMLQQNKHRWGNLQGVCGSGVIEMQQNYPEIYQKFLKAERQLEKWLQGQTQINGSDPQHGADVLPPAYEALRQALGDKGLADMLRDNKGDWGNYQGICGSAILEMRQNYPEIYRQFQETERRLEKWLQGQARVSVPGDYYGDAPAGTIDYLVAPDTFEDDLVVYGCPDPHIVMVQDEGQIQKAIDKANELKEGIANAKLIAKVTEVLKQAAKHASGETPDMIGALKLIGEAIGLMKELAPVGMSEMLDAYSQAINSVAGALEKIPLTLYDKAIDKAYSETGDPKAAAELADKFVDASAEDRERGIKRVTLKHLKTTHVPTKSLWDWKWFPWNWISIVPGDYNTDGMVNAADYPVWRAAFGRSVAAYSGADGNGDGVVDQADYVVWKKNFGSTISLDLRVGITGPCPPPTTNALRIMLIVQGWKDDSIEIRDAASHQAVEILHQERARIEQEVVDDLGPLAWAVFALDQPSQGELLQRELEIESPVYLLLREAANFHADPEVRARAQGVLYTVHPPESALPDRMFELPVDPPGPVVPAPAPVVDGVAVRNVAGEQQVSLSGAPALPSLQTENASAQQSYELRSVEPSVDGQEVESVVNRFDFHSEAVDPALSSSNYHSIQPDDPAKLPALFGSLPLDRYRIYLIEVGSERMILDFVIQQGQPIDTPEMIEPTDGIQPGDDVASQRVAGDVPVASHTTPGVTPIQPEIVPLTLTSYQPPGQDKSTPAKLGVTEEWQLVISDGTVTSTKKNGESYKGPLPANVARDVKPILDKLQKGMVGTILVRYYEVLGSDGKRLDLDGELKETITPASGVKTGGTKVTDGVVSTPDRLFHIDTDKNFNDKTLLQVIEVSGTVVAYHKITFTKTCVTVEELSKQQYEEELKKLGTK